MTVYQVNVPAELLPLLHEEVENYFEVYSNPTNAIFDPEQFRHVVSERFFQAVLEERSPVHPSNEEK